MSDDNTRIMFRAPAPALRYLKARAGAEGRYVQDLVWDAIVAYYPHIQEEVNYDPDQTKPDIIARFNDPQEREADPKRAA